VANERSAEQIRADLAAARADFASGVQGMVSEVHPQTIKDQTVGKVQDKVEDVKDVFTQTIGTEVKSVRNLFADEQGVRWDNIGSIVMAGSLVAGAVGAAALVGKGVVSLFNR